MRDCGTAGLRDCGTAGLRDCGTAGLRDLIVTGNITLAPSLITDGLVDEYRLFVHPVAPWSTAGRRLFADATSPATPRLTETWPLRPDIALLRYRTD
ncbi:Pyrimidine reductase, riboflavin biosynthesis [Streptomyces sp. SceaMP-e96]|uniref:dihydrofolate reductase family protein n=1 Tax=unclassified Streptomyces TaxID=2593676 RepID=UPI0008237ED9|nr:MULTISPECIES: dihydrofolate reductase family protein [unclassified Streptomyces]SCK05207.1 Pyrimidine reductase, riboflavin biosynthesis [Streptomyces sp. SceaMP-e96]